MVCINGVYVYKWCVRLWTSSELHSPAACRHSQRSHETEPPDRSVHRDVYLIAIRAIVQIAPISCDHPALVGRAFRVSVRLGNTVHRRISRILRSIQGFWDPLEAVESFRMLTNANECYPSLSRTISLSKCRKLFGIIPMDFGDSLSQYRFPSEASKLPAPKSASFSKSGEPKINVNTVQWNTWQSVKHKEAIERAIERATERATKRAIECPKEPVTLSQWSWVDTWSRWRRSLPRNFFSCFLLPATHITNGR